MIATLGLPTASVRSRPGNARLRRKKQTSRSQRWLTGKSAKKPFTVLESNVHLDVANYPAVRAFSIST